MHLTVEPEVILGLITIVAGITLYAFIKSRNAERLMQLQMGNSLENKSSNFEIKFGMLFIGIGIGILIAFILSKYFIKNATELYPAFIFLFGGLGLFISFFIVRRHKR